MRSLMAVSLLATLIGYGAVGTGRAVTIVCGLVPRSIDLCRSGSEAWAKARGQEVRVLAYPNSSTRARELIADLLEAQAEDLDVLELDIVWPGVLAPHLLDLGSPQDLEAEGHFPAAVASFTVGGRLRAAPWYLSVGRLLYRTDLLERYGLKVPASWEELAAAARTIQEGSVPRAMPGFGASSGRAGSARG